MSLDGINGQEVSILELVFSPTREITVRGSSVPDMLFHIANSLADAVQSGHTCVAVYTNSSYAYNSLNFWCQEWISLAGDDGVWIGPNGDPVPHQELLEAILEYQYLLEMRIFLTSPVTHALV